MAQGNAAGVTLVGLLTTLAVLAVLLAIGLPAWQGQIERRRLVAAETAITGVMQRARAIARRRGRAIDLVFAAAADGRPWCVAIRDGKDCDCLHVSCRLGVERPLSSARFPGIALSFRPRNGRITFFPIAATTSAGSVRIRAHGRERRIIVASSGRIRHCVIDLAGGPPCH